MSKINIAAESSRMRLIRLELDPFGTNAYVVICRETGESILVDAPGEAKLIVTQLEGTSPRCILITHSHADHTLALEEVVSKLEIPLAAHSDDAGALPLRPDRLLEDGNTVTCGRLSLEVLHTPGHTPGSLCFYLDDCLLSGDTIFPGGPGKTASPADFKQILSSITEKIFTLPGGTGIFPGHGVPTRMETEKKLYDQFASRPPDPELCGDVTWAINS